MERGNSQKTVLTANFNHFQPFFFNSGFDSLSCSKSADLSLSGNMNEGMTFFPLPLRENSAVLNLFNLLSNLQKPVIVLSSSQCFTWFYLLTHRQSSIYYRKKHFLLLFSNGTCQVKASPTSAVEQLLWNFFCWRWTAICLVRKLPYF